MKKQPLTLLPVLLLKSPELLKELQQAMNRTGLPRRDLPEHIEQIIASNALRSESLYVVVPYLHHILGKDPKTLENFARTGKIRNPDLIQVLSLAMQATDLDYAQFVAGFYQEYEATPYPDDEDNSDDEDWGYLPR